MLKNNIYNIDNEFDYPTIKNIVIQSLEKIIKEEVLKKRPNNVIFDFKHDEYSNNVKLSSPPNPFLKIRNPLILICILGA